METGSFSVDSSGALRRVVVRLARPDERIEWDRRIREHHYLRSRGLIGESLRYVAELDGEWLGLVGWCGAAFKCGARDRWIGWPEVIQWQRLSLVANNARFLILPGVRIPNLASRILGANVRRLSSDWERAHGHPVLLAETFVDPERFQGTCYRAAGWIALGKTRGFARSAGSWVEHGRPKLVLVRPLVRDAVRRLRDPNVGTERPRRMVMMKLTTQRTEQLAEVLARLPDSRSRQGRRHASLAILSLSVCAVLGGARSFTAISEWANRTTPKQRKRLSCRRNPRTNVWEVPSEARIRTYLQSVDVERVDAEVGAWLSDQMRGSAKGVALDGKTLRGAKRNGRQVQLLSAVVHGTGVTIGQTEVSEKSNEIPAAPELLAPLDLKGQVVTADAMHTQEKLAQYIVEEKKADYLFTVKDNQPTLKEDIKQMFEGVSIPPSGRNDREGSRSD